MTVSEPTMIGVAEATHPKLQRLKDDGHFREMADAYRFAIGLALAQGIDPPEISARTLYASGTSPTTVSETFTAGAGSGVTSSSL